MQRQTVYLHVTWSIQTRGRRTFLWALPSTRPAVGTTRKERGVNVSEILFDAVVEEKASKSNVKLM